MSRHSERFYGKATLRPLVAAAALSLLAGSALADLYVEGQVQPRAQALVRNFSDEDVSALKLSFLLDGKQVSSAKFLLLIK